MCGTLYAQQAEHWDHCSRKAAPSHPVGINALANHTNNN